MELEQSHNHCRLNLVRVGSDWKVQFTDLSSPLGTRVNGRPVFHGTSQLLQLNDRVQINGREYVLTQDTRPRQTKWDARNLQGSTRERPPATSTKKERAHPSPPIQPPKKTVRPAWILRVWILRIWHSAFRFFGTTQGAASILALLLLAVGSRHLKKTHSDDSAFSSPPTASEVSAREIVEPIAAPRIAEVPHLDGSSTARFPIAASNLDQNAVIKIPNHIETHESGRETPAQHPEVTPHVRTERFEKQKKNFCANSRLEQCDREDAEEFCRRNGYERLNWHKWPIYSNQDQETWVLLECTDGKPTTPPQFPSYRDL